MRKIVLMILVNIIYISAQMPPPPRGTCNSPYICVTPETFENEGSLSAVPYVNFTAQAELIDGVDTITASFYKTWDPDNRGNRPYQSFTIKNNSNTDTATFILTTTEYNNDCFADSKLWTGSVYNPTVVDDDRGRHLCFGTVVILPPEMSVMFHTSMYHVNSEPNWFGVHLMEATAYKINFYLDDYYPVVIGTQYSNDPIIIR